MLVAFVIVNEWQTFNDAQSTVSAESAALTTASFDAGVLPEPTRTRLQTALIAYDRSVICDEIPYLADHQGPSLKTRAAMQQLYAAAEDAPPAVQASPFFGNAVAQIAEVSTAATIASATPRSEKACPRRCCAATA